MITAAQLQQIAGRQVDQWVDPVNAAMSKYQINTSARQAEFLAQVMHESARLHNVAENLNYSADALTALFPGHFTSIEAKAYARQPAKIASRLYANRMGNGPESSLDGWTFRGRGLIQITGRANYDACGQALGLMLTKFPELLEQPLAAAESAAWFWQSHGLNQLADAGDIESITRRINGGEIGLQDRKDLYALADKVLTAA